MKYLEYVFPRKHYTEPHLIKTMPFSQRVSVRMFHEPFIRDACISRHYYKTHIMIVLFLSRKNFHELNLDKFQTINLFVWFSLSSWAPRNVPWAPNL